MSVRWRGSAGTSAADGSPDGPSPRAKTATAQFFDLFDMGGGSWAAVVGDLRGEGQGWAEVGRMARDTIRSLAREERKPDRMLARLNRALLDLPGEIDRVERFCTLCCARLRPHARGARVAVSSGGHPLPLLLRTDGRVRTVGRPGTLLGAFPEVDLGERIVELRPGDVLVLVTDSLLHQRLGPEVEGPGHQAQGLAAVLGNSVGLDSSAVAERVVAALPNGPTGTPGRDDLAVLALRITRLRRRPY